MQTAHIAAGDDGRVSAVVLADGRSLPAGLVLLGVGPVANDELAAQAGLAVSAASWSMPVAAPPTR